MGSSALCVRFRLEVQSDQKGGIKMMKKFAMRKPAPLYKDCLAYFGGLRTGEQHH